MKFTWSSFLKAKTLSTVGSRLMVDLPLLGIESVVVKVDTGAYNGALHATNIHEVSTTEGITKLQFSPLGSTDHTIEVAAFHKRKVKSSNGQMAIRYAIDTTVKIDGNTYPITLTLTNRGSMRHPMLIGRNFLRVHGFLVDVTRNNL